MAEMEYKNGALCLNKLNIDDNESYTIDDKENRSEILLDSSNKIISYRKEDGTKVENICIETNRLLLTEDGMTDFQKSLKDSGFSGGTGDWSDKKELHIDEPYCAFVNFSGIYEIPQHKGVNLHGLMEFWDMNGNYFKKEVIMNGQGQSSMTHPKKNIAVDICNNNGWDDDDTFKLQIGSWIPQDSFHIKAFYNDPFRCLCPVAYKWYDQIVKTRGELNDYVWKRALINSSSITPTSTGLETAEDAESQFNTGARCFPDGFPCIVYLNGEFYGIYSWQLKKHRDNYHMKKSDTKHIHLDGVINDSVLFDGIIDWTSFEVRNPKDLITMEGGKYDGDNPTELIDSTSPNYDSTNKKHVNTAAVKQRIVDLSNIKNVISSAYETYLASEKTSQDIEDFKGVYETYFDIDNLIDYIIFSDVSHNYDGFNKNWQWLTYNGVKWYLGVYDCDGVFGNYFSIYDDTILPPSGSHVNVWQLIPLYDVYKNELNSRYAELRNSKIIDADNIIGFITNWLDRVGNKDTFDKEWKKWPDFIKNDNVHRVYVWLKKSIQNMDSVYSYSSSNPLRYAGTLEKGNVLEVSDDGTVRDSGRHLDHILGYTGELIKGNLLEVDNVGIAANFTLYSDTYQDEEIRAEDIKITSKEALTTSVYVYVKAHITKVTVGEGVYDYVMSDGYEGEESGVSYKTVAQTVNAASSLLPDTPSEGFYYIRAKVKNVDFSKFGKPSLKDAGVEPNE